MWNSLGVGAYLRLTNSGGVWAGKDLVLGDKKTLYHVTSHN